MAQPDRGGIVTISVAVRAPGVGRRERPELEGGLIPLPVSLHNGDTVVPSTGSPSTIKQ